VLRISVNDLRFALNREGRVASGINQIEKGRVAQGPIGTVFPLALSQIRVYLRLRFILNPEPREDAQTLVGTVAAARGRGITALHGMSPGGLRARLQGGCAAYGMRPRRGPPTA
jgi:hypothetical protein